MTPRESTRVWLRDLIDHLQELEEELAWTDDTTGALLLIDTMFRDLESVTRICEDLRRRILETQYAEVA